MSINIRFPNITGRTEAEQLVQVKSYLHQLVEQLNWALTSIQSGSVPTSNTSTEAPLGDVSAATFYELKSLIIKSADTLNAYYEKIDEKLIGKYVTQGDFEAYKKEPKYTLPVGGTELGGVKNGGNVTIKQDGAMDFDITVLVGEYVTQKDFDAYKQEPKYTLPVGGTELGGVKNGGNVTILPDGTLTADIPSDEHIIELINRILDERENVTT